LPISAQWRHEGGGEVYRLSCLASSLGGEWSTSRHGHFDPCERALVPTKKKAGWTDSWSGYFGKENNPLSLLEFETWIPACNIVVAFTTKRHSLGMDFQVFMAVFVKIVKGALFYHTSQVTTFVRSFCITAGSMAFPAVPIGCESGSTFYFTVLQYILGFHSACSVISRSVTITWHVLILQVKEQPPIWRSSSLGSGKGAKNSS